MFSFMGVGFSGFAANQNYGVCSPSKPGLDDLPENCIASILKYLDPPEICKLAQLNKTFRGASWADFVWESKLPTDHKFLVDKVLHGNPENLPKKEIYARLCRPNSFDHGTKEVWLDKSSGKIFMLISSKALRITGIDDRRYWNYLPTEESRFHTIAYLKKNWWVEILGELEFEFPPGKYSLFFRLQLGKASKRFARRVCNLDQVHGWDIKPVRFQLSTISNGTGDQHAVVLSHGCYLRETGKWIHYQVGDFVVDHDDQNRNTPTKIKFSMDQIDCTHTKGGLCVDSVFICPTEFGERLK
ncbi:hypothetical protein F2P56_021861 [Juglans regia]|uniref:F-box protein PP2-A11-like n=2 Tax=Juglans regia TaxID=51240 RepID=A0A2I4GZ49_JUGRE|nr:F-box protein PP2-A11-like [Juglans regia]KAF5457781.1 hypothetical protein F2P56_021861 [Juglans regia]